MVMWVESRQPAVHLQQLGSLLGKRETLCKRPKAFPLILGLLTLGPPPFLYKSPFLLRRALKKAASTVTLAKLTPLYWRMHETSPRLNFTGGMVASWVQSPFKPAEIPPPTCTESQQQTQGSYRSLGSTLSPKCHQPPLLYDTHDNRKALHQKAKTQGTEAHATGRLPAVLPANTACRACLWRDTPDHLLRPCVNQQKIYSHVFPCCKPSSVISTDNCEIQLANEEIEGGKKKVFRLLTVQKMKQA